MKLFPEILIAGVVSGVVTVVDSGGAQPPPLNYSNILDSAVMLGEKFGVMFIILVYFLGRDYLRSKADAKERSDMFALLSERDNYIREELATKLAEAAKEVYKARTIHTVLIDTLKSNKCTEEAIREHLDSESRRSDEKEPTQSYNKRH